MVTSYSCHKVLLSISPIITSYRSIVYRNATHDSSTMPCSSLRGDHGKKFHQPPAVISKNLSRNYRKTTATPRSGSFACEAKRPAGYEGAVGAGTARTAQHRGVVGSAELVRSTKYGRHSLARESARKGDVSALKAKRNKKIRK